MVGTENYGVVSVDGSGAAVLLDELPVDTSVLLAHQPNTSLIPKPNGWQGTLAVPRSGRFDADLPSASTRSLHDQPLESVRRQGMDR